MKRLLIASFAVTLFVLPQTADAKVGVVSFEEVLSKTRSGIKISKTISSYFKRKQISINRRKKALQSEEKNMITAFKQLEASKTILKASIYKARKSQLEQRYRKLLLKGQRLMQKVTTENEELQKRRYKLLQPLRTTFLSTTQAVAKARGYDLVIERSAVYFHKGAIDITSIVIGKINAVTK